MIASLSLVLYWLLINNERIIQEGIAIKQTSDRIKSSLQIGNDSSVDGNPEENDGNGTYVI